MTLILTDSEPEIEAILSDVPEDEFCWCDTRPDEEEEAFNKCKSCGGRFP